MAEAAGEPRRIVVVGDSHVAQLAAGWHLLQDECEAARVDVTFHAWHGVNWLKPDISMSIRTIKVVADDVPGSRPLDFEFVADGSEYVFSSILHSAPTYRHKIWRAHTPWTVFAENDDLTPISTDEISAFVASQTSRRLELINLLVNAGIDLRVAEPPKPLLRSPTLHGIRSSVLSAADKIHRSYVLGELKKIGVPVILAPSQTYGKDGFTLEEYGAPSSVDPHHGSSQFGEVMMTEILNFVTPS
jgi:hypothetical protein